jgi:hypothetical protein
MAFEITYELDATVADDFIDAIRVEQSIEFPLHLAPQWIANQVVGQVIKTNSPQASRVSVTVAYGDEVVASEFAQFLNLLWGNISLLKDVVITEISLPDSFLKSLQGPRFGLRGLRQTLGIESRPLLMTALKPMGLDSEQLGWLPLWSKVASTSSKMITISPINLGRVGMNEFRLLLAQYRGQMRNSGEEPSMHQALIDPLLSYQNPHGERKNSAVALF